MRTQENVASVTASVKEDTHLSIRRRSQEVGLCYATILTKDLGLVPSKIQLTKELMSQDPRLHRTVSEWFLVKNFRSP